MSGNGRAFRGAGDRRGRDGDDFDPVAEGEPYGLDAEILRRIWDRVKPEGWNVLGFFDTNYARQRFHEVAREVAARGGFLGVAPGKVTRVETEILGRRVIDPFAIKYPGKVTRVEAETRRWRRLGSHRDRYEREVDALVAACSPEARERDDVSEHRALARAILGDAPGGDAPQAPPLVPTSAPVEVPHRDQMEQVFGATLAHVRAHLGESGVLAPHGARGAAMPGVILLASEDPDPATVAHELAHVAQLDRASADAAPPRRPWSVSWDAAELEADAVGQAVARGARSVRVSARPEAAVSFDTSPGSPAALDRGVEASIRGLLEQPLAATDVAGIQARVRSLMTIFRSIPEDARMALHERLSIGTDELAVAFHARLHRATRERLLGVLRGDAVPLPTRHDAMTPEGFAAHLRADPIEVSPSPLVIHPRFSPQVTGHITLRSEFGPPADGPPAAVVVRVFDAEGSEHGTERVPWLVAMPSSAAAIFTFDRAGSYRVECEITHGGLVVAQRRATIEVTDPAEEVAAGAADRAATNALRAGAGIPGIALAAAEARASAGTAGDLAAAQQLAPDQLHDAHARMTAQLAGESNIAERARISSERNLIELAAVSRGGDAAAAIARPPTPADRVTLWEYYRGALDVSADPAFLRHWIEQTFISGGMSAVDGLVDLVQQTAWGDYAAANGDTRARDFALGQVVPALAAQIARFRTDVRMFEGEFGRTATDLVKATLNESERIALGELAKYGVTVIPGGESAADENGMTVQFEDQVSGGQNAKAEAMAEAAARLAANQRGIDRMRARVRELEAIQAYREICTFAEDDLAAEAAWAEACHAEDVPDVSRGPDPAELPAVLASLRRLVAQAETEHAQQIATETKEFPLLANYKREREERVDVDADGLDRLQGIGRAQEIWSRVAPVLSNIDELRGAIGGRFKIWKEPRVVQMTMAHMAVVPGTLYGAIVAEKQQHENEGDWTDWAILALTVGLALLAAIPTGGSSVVAAVVATAAIADATLSVYLVADHIAQYQIEEAATGTDLDAKARAISSRHPSAFWLAVDIVATCIGLPGGAKTVMKTAAEAFGAVADDVVRATEAAARAEKVMGAAEADLAVARVHRLAREGKMSAETAEKASGIIRGASLADDASDVADAAGRVDQRARVAVENLDALGERLGVRVELDDGLSNGVELHYQAKPGRLGIGTDIEPSVIRVGRAATIEDVLAHRATVERITKYNGVTGKLRGLWDRFVVGAGGGVNPFKKGTVAWESFEEVRKIDGLIESRRAAWGGRLADAQTLDDEIAFLEGRRAYHEEILRTAEETGALKAAGMGHVAGPDVGKVTREAQAKGYKLPGEAPGTEGMDPSWYYYRSSTSAPGEYELARMPGAPTEAPQYRAVTKDGQFVGLELGERAPTWITGAWDDAQVVEHMWNDSTFSSFASMAEREGLMSREAIDEAILAARRGGDIADTAIRKAIKDELRDKVIAKLTDPRLDAKESWKQMRRMLDGLDNTERGNLAERWYQARYAPHATHQVNVKVPRTSGPNAGALEPRRLDLLDGDRVIEMKDIEGAIDRDQFKAYMDMLDKIEIPVGDDLVTPQKLRYVFTKPEGARANLAFFADELMKSENRGGRLAIEVFDTTGVRHVIRTSEDARAMLALLGGTP